MGGHPVLELLLALFHADLVCTKKSGTKSKKSCSNQSFLFSFLDFSNINIWHLSLMSQYSFNTWSVNTSMFYFTSDIQRLVATRFSNRHLKIFSTAFMNRGLRWHRLTFHNPIVDRLHLSIWQKNVCNLKQKSCFKLMVIQLSRF